jgi:hypothetical protein
VLHEHAHEKAAALSLQRGLYDAVRELDPAACKLPRPAALEENAPLAYEAPAVSC